MKERAASVGDVTSAEELADTFNGDSPLINLLTIAFVFIILIFTFRSVVGAALLVFVIQGKHPGSTLRFRT